MIDNSTAHRVINGESLYHPISGVDVLPAVCVSFPHSRDGMVSCIVKQVNTVFVHPQCSLNAEEETM